MSILMAFEWYYFQAILNWWHSPFKPYPTKMTASHSIGANLFPYCTCFFFCPKIRCSPSSYTPLNVWQLPTGQELNRMLAQWAPILPIHSSWPSAIFFLKVYTAQQKLTAVEIRLKGTVSQEFLICFWFWKLNQYFFNRRWCFKYLFYAWFILCLINKFYFTSCKCFRTLTDFPKPPCCCVDSCSKGALEL